jgi:hypothetical protein
MGDAMYFLIWVAFHAAAAYWVYMDAKKRPMNAVGWAIGALVFCPVFVPLYLIMRKPEVPQGYPPPGTPGYPGYTPPPPPPPIPGMVPPPPAAPASGPAHFCVQCGQKYEGTAKFCPACGAMQV